MAGQLVQGSDVIIEWLDSWYWEVTSVLCDWFILYNNSYEILLYKLHHDAVNNNSNMECIVVCFQVIMVNNRKILGVPVF